MGQAAARSAPRRPLAALQSALTFAGLVWNEATHSQSTAADVAETVSRDVAEAGRPLPSTMRQLVAELVESRWTAYADERRVFLRARSPTSAAIVASASHGVSDREPPIVEMLIRAA